MAKSQRDAYAGVLTMPDGSEVLVVYLNKRGVERTFGDWPRAHPKRRKIGWYWTRTTGRDRPHFGPFLSSRAAMHDAQKNHPAAKAA